MGLEIERKFLVVSSDWRSEVDRAEPLRQGYLSTEASRVVRVRVAGEQGFLTVKGKRVGDRRAEFEYPIPVEDADAMLEHLCLRPFIAKVRYHLNRQPGDWIVDVFEKENDGLILAEVEFSDASPVTDLPDWIGTEVTTDDRYGNSNLQAHPYSTW
jgi:CYTH domain-containing protein